MERWHGKLLAHALRLLGRPEAAADVTQDAWIAMVRGIGRLEDPAKFPPWAYRIIANKATDFLRRRQVERHQLGNQQDLDSHVAEPPPAVDADQMDRRRLREAIRRAAERIGNYRLIEATLYVTIEPCAMCAGAMVNSRIKRLVFGATELRAGAIESVFQICNNSSLNHQVEVTSEVRAEECRQIMQAFFKERRKAKTEN